MFTSDNWPHLTPDQLLCQIAGGGYLPSSTLVWLRTRWGRGWGGQTPPPGPRTSSLRTPRWDNLILSAGFCGGKFPLRSSDLFVVVYIKIHVSRGIRLKALVPFCFSCHFYHLGDLVNFWRLGHLCLQIKSYGSWSHTTLKLSEEGPTNNSYKSLIFFYNPFHWANLLSM